MCVLTASATHLTLPRTLHTYATTSTSEMKTPTLHLFLRAVPRSTSMMVMQSGRSRVRRRSYIARIFRCLANCSSSKRAYFSILAVLTILSLPIYRQSGVPDLPKRAVGTAGGLHLLLNNWG